MTDEPSHATPAANLPATKVADRPHRWTVVLSVIAASISLASAAFSYLSLTETRENRRINEETARAYLKVTSLLLDAPLFSEKNWARKSGMGFLTVTNTGRVAAKQIDTLLDLNPPNAEMLYNVARFSEIPPGSSNTVRILVQMDNKRGLTFLSDRKEYLVGIKLEYNDGLHQDRKADEVTFCVPVEKTRAQTIINLYACDTHFGYGPDKAAPKRVDR